jgi:biopolymer transport protein ExbD
MPEKKESQSATFRREAKDEKCDINMTPMVDCVFQLLIFFICACRFRTSEEHIKAFLPKNRGLGTKGPVVVPPFPVRVKLLWVEPNSLKETKEPDRGRVILKVKDKNFRWVTNQFGETLPDYEELYKLILEQQRVFVPRGIYQSQPVIIDARPLVPFKHVVYALNACVRAKITDITFAAPEMRETPY